MNSLQADEISIERLKKIFQKSCTQSIDNAISINSTNTNNCNLKYINEFPKIKELEISELKKKINEQNIILKNLNKKSSSIYKNSQKNNILEHQLSNAISESNKLKLKLNQLNKKHLDLKKIIQNFNKEQQNLLKKDKDFINRLDRKYSINLKEIGSIQERLINIENSIYIQKTISEKQQKEIRKVKNETNKLKILFSKYIFNISNNFIGSYSEIGLSNHYMFGLEYEGYNARKQNSIFVNLSYEKFNNKFSYSTLDGLDNLSIDNEKTLYGMEIGYKDFHYLAFNNFRWYHAFSFGLAEVQNDSLTMTGKLSLGLEYEHKTSEVKSNKFYIEGGYRYLDNINILESKFNSFGNGQSANKEKRFGLGYISIKYLWRL
jgi:hypothetical protein